jgi:5'-nucleotidase
MHRLDRVLLTNDDGIDAPGLAVLEQVAAELAREVWIVAPAHDQSGTSHSISLHSPLRSRASATGASPSWAPRATAPCWRCAT